MPARPLYSCLIRRLRETPPVLRLSAEQRSTPTGTIVFPVIRARTAHRRRRCRSSNSEELLRRFAAQKLVHIEVPRYSGRHSRVDSYLATTRCGLLSVCFRPSLKTTPT